MVGRNVPSAVQNPTQHFSDLVMLSVKEELEHVFQNKDVDCARVGGATDEGPSHELAQYWWTERHVRMKKIATLVTLHSRGSSYMNRVELQNGCLSLGHANTFIPSTLPGSCVDQDAGKVNEAVL